MKPSNLKRHNYILHVKSTILSEGLWDDQQRIRKRLNAHLRPPLRALLRILDQINRTGYFKGTGTWYQRLVLQSVLDCPETITEGVLNLLDGMRVGALDEKRYRFRIANFIDEGVFLFAESMFVY